jgi:hypothetical protein
MKKTFLMLTTAILLLCMLQGGVGAQDLSPVRPATRAIRAIPATPNGPGTPATPAVRATPASPAAVTLQAAIEKTEDAVNEPSEAGESLTNPVVPTKDNSQGDESYIAVLKPTFDQVVWVEAPSAAPGWEFSVLRGARLIQSADFPGTADDIFTLIVGGKEFQAKGGETYIFTPPVSKFVVKKETNTAEKLSIGLHYTGSGKTKLGMKPVN